MPDPHSTPSILDRQRPRPKHKVETAADAHRPWSGPCSWLASAAIVGALNSIQVAARLAPGLRPSTRLLVHAYDFGFALLLGLLVALTVVAARALNARWPAFEKRMPTWFLLLAAGAILGALTLKLDLGNFVVRHHWRIKPAALGALVGALAFAVAQGLDWLLRGSWGRIVAFSLGVAAAYCNATFLVADYRGVHFFVGLFALLACAKGVALRCPIRVERGLLLGVTLVTVICVCTAPRDSVRKGLWASSGSALFPLIADWAAVPRHHPAHEHPTEASPWFTERSHRPELASTHSQLVSKQPIVLLLTIEALRADVIERADLPTRLPALAKIRDSSRWFRQARTPSPATVVTATSLLTGKYYSQIYFSTIAPGAVEAVHDRSIRVPELLESNGIETTFVVAYRSLLGKYGVGRGFGREIKTRANFGPATEVMQYVIDELERNRSTTGAPQFVFAHFVDSHYPYNQAGEKETPFEGYLAELGLIDQQLARLFEYLESSGQQQRVVLLLSADHGEAFGEHGMLYHGKNIYEELIRIPLMIHGPSIRPGSVEHPVTLLDLSPTILDLFGVSTPGSFMGQSLVPLLEGKNQRLERPIAVDSGRRKQALYFEDGIKVILDLPARTVEVYDLAHDPAELHDLIDDPARDFTAHIAATERFFATHTLQIPGWQPPWRRS